MIKIYIKAIHLYLNRYTKKTIFKLKITYNNFISCTILCICISNTKATFNSSYVEFFLEKKQ